MVRLEEWPPHLQEIQVSNRGDDDVELVFQKRSRWSCGIGHGYREKEEEQEERERGVRERKSGVRSVYRLKLRVGTCEIGGVLEEERKGGHVAVNEWRGRLVQSHHCLEACVCLLWTIASPTEEEFKKVKDRWARCRFQPCGVHSLHMMSHFRNGSHRLTHEGTPTMGEGKVPTPTLILIA